MVAANGAPMSPLLGIATCLAHKMTVGFFELMSKPKTFPREMKRNPTLPATPVCWGRSTENLGCKQKAESHFSL